MNNMNTVASVASVKTVTRKIGVQKGVHHRNKLEIGLDYIKGFMNKEEMMKEDLMPIVAELEAALQKFANRPKANSTNNTIKKLAAMDDEALAELFKMVLAAKKAKDKTAEEVVLDEENIDQYLAELA